MTLGCGVDSAAEGHFLLTSALAYDIIKRKEYSGGEENEYIHRS